jgi:DNA-binding PadR family transcriptional regulator
MAFNRTHLILLSILSKVEAISAARAVTMQYISEYCQIGKSYTTLLRAIHLLKKNGFIAQGVKDGQFNTYFITMQGKDKLKEML